MRLRPSRAGEEAALGAAAHDAFRVNEPDSWVQYFVQHSSRAPADTLVAEIDGEMVGHATALRLSMRFRGAELAVRGLSAVAVLPHFRRRGVADKLVRAWIARFQRDGEPFLLLMPFSVRFYRKYGFGIVEELDLLRVAPQQLPPSPLRQHVRRARLPDDQGIIEGIYARWREGQSGALARDEYWWKGRIFPRVPEAAIYETSGYILYEIPGAPILPSAHCLVREIVATTPDAFRGLVGFLEALGEQFARVELLVPRGQGAILLEDVPVVPESSHYKLAAWGMTGAMARLTHVPRALALHPGRSRGRIGLDVEGQAWDVSFDGRGAHARPGSDARRRLALTPERLAQVYFGTAAASDLHARGFAGGDLAAARILDEAFAGPPPFLGRLNYF
jgi:predicted acetyltransferase